MKISVSTRDLNDSKFRMRKQGLIPGIVYSKNKNQPVVIESKDLGKAMSSHEPVIETSMGDTVVLKEIQRDPVSSKIIHVSFQEISNGSFTIKIPIVLKNTSDFSSQGMVLKILSDKVEVKTSAKAMTEHILLDISGLKVNEVLRVKDLPVMTGIQYLDDPETQLVVLNYQRQEPEPEALKAPVAAEVPLVKDSPTPNDSKA